MDALPQDLIAYSFNYLSPDVLFNLILTEKYFLYIIKNCPTLLYKLTMEEICIGIDVTASMSSYIKQVIVFIKDFVYTLLNSNQRRRKIRLGRVGEYGEPLEAELSPLTNNITILQDFINSCINEHGRPIASGGDAPECHELLDHQLYEITKNTTYSNSNIVPNKKYKRNVSKLYIYITDAPCHGIDTHDFHKPHYDPLTTAHNLKSQSIRKYTFCVGDNEALATWAALLGSITGGKALKLDTTLDISSISDKLNKLIHFDSIIDKIIINETIKNNDFYVQLEDLKKNKPDDLQFLEYCLSEENKSMILCKSLKECYEQKLYFSSNYIDTLSSMSPASMSTSTSTSTSSLSLTRTTSIHSNIPMNTSICLRRSSTNIISSSMSEVLEENINSKKLTLHRATSMGI